MLRKRVLSSLVVLSAVMSLQSAPSLSWIKKNIMDASPFNLFFEITPKDEWLDEADSFKNTFLRIVAKGCYGVVPTVGTKLKKEASILVASMLGKKRWRLGPITCNSKTVAYCGVNGVYGITFAQGTLPQKVLYTLYKMFVQKMPARYIASKITAGFQCTGVPAVLQRSVGWWVEKPEYTKIIFNVANKVLKSTIEVLIDECVGCYIVPKIYA